MGKQSKSNDRGNLDETVVDPLTGTERYEDYEEEEERESDSELKGGIEYQSEYSSRGTYPDDCYSFIAIHGPFDKKFYCFFFGLLVWMFQICFLILLVLRVAHPTLSTNENDDNPDQGQREGFQLANFVPSNNNVLSRATQYMALTSYCFFADASVRDIVTAIETFPNFSRVRPGDRVHLLILSCLLRLSQGLLATVVVFFLVINTSDVIDIILNFTAVNFISDFDSVAFELCKWGKYGPQLKAEAERLETIPAPPCVFRKYQHIRYRFTVVPLAFILLGFLVVISWSQNSLDKWVTTRLRVQFKKTSNYGEYNGCYDYVMRQEKRVLLESFEENEAQAKFGYCQRDKKWFLFKGNKTSACDTTDEDLIAFSSKTYAFDISTVFEDTWYSPTGTPLELYFFDDQKNNLSDDECRQFLGDGICDDVFNIFDHNFDNGDCCGTTCSNMNCEFYNSISEAFNANIQYGSGYNKCTDPSMKAITIKVQNVYIPPEPDYGISIKKEEGIVGAFPPIDPLLKLDCEGKNILMVNINTGMESATQTVFVPDGAKCKIDVQNAAGGIRPLRFVNYTIYHGDAQSIETEPLVILQADSYEQRIHNFQRIPECFFARLEGAVDMSSIYIGNEAANRAIKWLANEAHAISSCKFDTFLERFALATLNFAAPIEYFLVTNEDDDVHQKWVSQNWVEDGDNEGLWIDSNPHCEWDFVLCLNGRVIELNLGRDVTKFSVFGTIPTEIGLLKNITWVDLTHHSIFGTIPTEIGKMESLRYFGAPLCWQLTGSIPTELGNLSQLEFFVMTWNQLNGTIPSEIGTLSSLKGFIVTSNWQITGTIPSEIGRLSSLEYVFLEDCLLNGTLPTILGNLSNLTQLSLFQNEFTGTIPRELGSLPNLKSLRLFDNSLTGTIPVKLLDGSIETFEYYENKFSNLLPLDGRLICSADNGIETYCNCNTDCTFASQQCECAAAQLCCSLYLGDKEQCNACENPENGDMIVKEYATDCNGLWEKIREDVVQFGQKEKCDAAKNFMEAVGCYCNHDGDHDEWEDHHDEDHDEWEDHHDEDHDEWEDHHDEDELNDNHEDHEEWEDHHDTNSSLMEVNNGNEDPSTESTSSKKAPSTASSATTSTTDIIV